MQGKPEKTMIPHLIKCTKVSPEVRERAKQQKNKDQDENMPVRTLSVTPSLSRAGTPAPPRSPLGSIQPDSSAMLTVPRPVKRQRTDEWTPSHQQEFSADLLKVFVSAGIPWNAANDPELRQFHEKWIPGSKTPDRRVLSGRLLDKEATEAENRMQKRMQGKLATGQCDGWKNVARASIVASMVTVEGEVSSRESALGCNDELIFL